MSANKAAIMAVLGASGSGKSTFIKREIGKARRLMVWDPMHEYGEFGQVVTRLADLGSIIEAKGFRAVFQPVADGNARARQFDMFCRMGLAARNLTMVVEELRFVTTPSRAPMGWAQVCLTGRHAGLTVYGASQRPASIDKDFLGNCTRIRTGRLVYPADVRAVSEASQMPADEIRALKPLEWLEMDTGTHRMKRGALTF